MADRLHITRRLALLGAAASSVALAVPAVKAAHLNEDIAAKVDRLSAELSAALSEWCKGQFTAVVKPGGDVQFVSGDQLTKGLAMGRFLASGSNRSVAEYHLFEAAKLCSTEFGGRWDVNPLKVPGAATPFCVGLFQRPGSGATIQYFD